MENNEKSSPLDRFMSSPEYSIDLNQQYGSTAVNVLSRFQLYKHSIDNRDIHQELAHELSLLPKDTIVDVGCADGQFLENLINANPIPLNIIGIDLDPELLNMAYGRRNVLKDTHLISGNADNLPLRDNDVDGLFALFMLYHSSNPSIALTEFHRVLKPDGKLAVATSGPQNKTKHRSFEHQIAEYLGVRPPQIFSNSFSSENAEDQLSLKFKINKHVTQRSEIHITNENYEDYLLSLQSMKGVFNPEPIAHSWTEAIGKIVLPQIKQEICTNGYFSDSVDRHYYICSPI